MILIDMEHLLDETSKYTSKQPITKKDLSELLERVKKIEICRCCQCRFYDQTSLIGGWCEKPTIRIFMPADMYCGYGESRSDAESRALRLKKYLQQRNKMLVIEDDIPPIGWEDRKNE